jgi:hypothetical protein
MRSNGGPRLLIVYCADFKCSHSVIISSNLWPENIRLSDLEPNFTCKACGRRGADVRPLLSAPPRARAEGPGCYQKR